MYSFAKEIPAGYMFNRSY